jgi:hypothetical protein
MRITVKRLDNTYFEVDIDETATLWQFKQKVEAEHNIPAVRIQRYVFHGNVMKDDQKLLTDYGLCDGMSIHLVLCI